eukprot:GEMP01049488.1.p1 GENE.GEMP01049488.1~~GEMP01049488.1.p1  ORF type:complete len:289 (-),score=46.61 GEMP01049488.1:727-1593(-)
MFFFLASVAFGLTVLDDSNILSDTPCTSQICTKPPVDLAKVKLALEQIPSPSHRQVIVEVLPLSEEPRGDAWLHDNANLRLSDCVKNLDENKRECPFAYIVIDSNPSALRAAALGPSNLGIGISMSPKSNTECMSNFLKSQLIKAPEHLQKVGWHSSVQLAPFALQIALPILKDLGGPCEPEGDYFIPMLAFSTICLTSIAIVFGGIMIFYRSQDPRKMDSAQLVPGNFTLEDGSGVQVFSKPVAVEEGSEKVAELKSGPCELYVEEMSNGWLRISSPAEGWISLEKY